MSDAAAIISAIKDIVLACAGAITGFVAIRGLKTWRDELRGKADFDAARTLLRATLKLRDELQSCRSPLLRGTEYPPGYTGGKNSSATEAQALAHVFRNRWEPVKSAVQEFDATSLEAEALWGSDIRERTLALRRCVVTVSVALEAIIEDKAAGDDHFERDREFGRRTRAQAFASPEATDNQLSQGITAAVDGIESVLREKMTHSR